MGSCFKTNFKCDFGFADFAVKINSTPSNSCCVHCNEKPAPIEIIEPKVRGYKKKPSCIECFNSYIVKNI